MFSSISSTICAPPSTTVSLQSSRGCAQELLAHNLTNSAISTHAIILLKDPDENSNENISTGIASQHAIGYGSAQTWSRRAAFIFNISQSQRRDIFIKHIFVKDIDSINNCLQSIPLLFEHKGQAARLLWSPKSRLNLPPEVLYVLTASCKPRKKISSFIKQFSQSSFMLTTQLIFNHARDWK